MSTYLETDRLIFRDFTPEDRAFIAELDSDPEVMKHLSDGIPSPPEEVDRAMGVFLKWKKEHQNTYGFWLAMTKDTQETIGWFHLRPIKHDITNFDNLEIGYRLKRKYWGKGYATEGSLALVEKAKELKACEVWAVTMIGNIPSQRIMQKCGMVLDREDVYEDFPGEDKRCVWYKLSL
jgi:RimJ/RimL family protein N-acetyltransferase